MPSKSSDITITDQFCGAGGSSQGAAQVEGVRIRMALNHWKLAIETHNTNFPETDHDCTDVSACDPRRYPSTNILITSPECTNHSLASGKKRRGLDQRDMFVAAPPNPADERSRATMWDVPRFAEYHDYEYVVVENVPDATKWVQFPAWLHAMKLLGYEHRVLSLNSMFFWPCPQSRDRMYVVFWKKGNPAPDLEHTPRAWCTRCEKNVNALQTWKVNSRTGRQNRVGKYDSTGKQNQYFYSCPSCRIRVEPYFFCALNAIDFSIPAERIGDRKRPLKERTLERIRYGLEKYGRQHLVIRTNMTSGVGCRVRDAAGAPLDTQPGSNISALVSSSIVETAWSHAPADRVSGGDEPLAAQTTRLTKGIAMPAPFMATNRIHHRPKSSGEPLDAFCTAAHHGVVFPQPVITTAGSRETAPSSGADPVPCLTGSERFGVTLAPAFVSTMRGTGADQLPSTAEGLNGSLGTISAGGVHHALTINGAALLTMRDSRGVGYLLRGLDEAMGVQVAAGTQDFLISEGQFLVPYNRTGVPRGVGGELATLTTLDRLRVAEAGEDLDVNDCFFRMLQPAEIQTGMAFDQEYVILGNKRDQVKQLGNAVTPPAMKWIIGRLVAALTLDRVA